MRLIFGIIASLFLVPAGAMAQSLVGTDQSPLVCHELEGVAVVVDRMVERTQIGALGNRPSDDIMRNQGSCAYNGNTTIRMANTVWLENERWLIRMEIVDLGNDIFMWQPAEVIDRNDWHLPRGCRSIQTSLLQGEGISARRFMQQGIEIPWRCQSVVPGRR